MLLERGHGKMWFMLTPERHKNARMGIAQTCFYFMSQVLEAFEHFTFMHIKIFWR